MITQQNALDNIAQLIKKYGSEFGLYDSSFDGDNKSSSVVFRMSEGREFNDTIFLIYSKNIQDVTDEM